LPTDAEWEYAYRAGSKTPFYHGLITSCCSDSNALQIGWFLSNSNKTTHPVGIKQPNFWGLYDMAGNVMELVHDWHQANLGTAAVIDPVASSGEKSRVLRGGYWDGQSRYMRAANRGFALPSYQYDSFGFRCVRSLLP
jgi:formylglycine-generating enzyme required for sulfatase activity